MTKLTIYCAWQIINKTMIIQRPPLITWMLRQWLGTHHIIILLYRNIQTHLLIHNNTHKGGRCSSSTQLLQF